MPVSLLFGPLAPDPFGDCYLYGDMPPEGGYFQ